MLEIPELWRDPPYEKVERAFRMQCLPDDLCISRENIRKILHNTATCNKVRHQLMLIIDAAGED